MEIMLNRERRKVLSGTMTGADLIAVLAVPSDYDLWRIVPGQCDQKITPNEVVVFREGRRFFACSSIINQSACPNTPTCQEIAHLDEPGANDMKKPLDKCCNGCDAPPQPPS